MKKAIKKDKKFIRDGFDGIAAKYDFFNNFITFGQHRRIKNSKKKIQKKSPKNAKNLQRSSKKKLQRSFCYRPYFV